MNNQDYTALGFKAGIECHQQLDGSKLFCHCPCIIKDETFDFEIKRNLKLSESELGTLDPATQFEIKKNKYFVYKGYKDVTCLVELDEQPPEGPNVKALDIALQAALLFHAKPIDVIQFMRKIVIDGSNTTGFQRTAIIAFDGYVDTSLGKVRIPSIYLEEDACQKIESNPEYISWNLSRLGIPMIEVATAPDIKTPEHAKETAEKIGMTLRSIKGIKRGLGTIRQDLNLSIKGHPRIEIKGFQDLRSIPKILDNEIHRQLKLKEIHEKVKNIKEYHPIAIDVSHIFANTNCKLIKNVLDKNGKIFGARLLGFGGLLGFEINENRRFGTELSDHARMFGVGGLIHSDENLSKYNFSEKEILDIKQRLAVQKDDAFILVADEADKSFNAINAAIERANKQYVTAFDKEVRNPKPDFTTSFSRPMPGSKRMYPETDVKPIYISKELLSKIEIPELIADKVENLEEEYGIQPEQARELLKLNKLELFVKCSELKNVNASFIAEMIIALPKELKRRANIEYSIDDAFFFKIFSHLNNNEIAKESLFDIFTDHSNKKEFNLSKYKKVLDSDLELEIKKYVEANKNVPFGGLMGDIMKKFNGKVDGKKASELIRKYLK